MHVHISGTALERQAVFPKDISSVGGESSKTTFVVDLCMWCWYNETLNVY